MVLVLLKGREKKETEHISPLQIKSLWSWYQQQQRHIHQLNWTKKMITNSLTQIKSSPDQVYIYTYTISNSGNRNPQVLKAVFPSLPSMEDWQALLSDWVKCGYYLSSPPVLIDTAPF